MAAASNKRPDSSVSCAEFKDVCKACEEDGNHVESDWYCIECREFLCEECYQVHRKPRALRHHTLVDKISFLHCKERKDAITDTCGRHKGKLLEYLCPAHAELTCVSCVDSKHIHCKNVLLISEESANVLTSDLYRDFHSTLDSIENTSQEVVNQVQGAVSETDDVCNATVKQLKEYRDELNNVLDNFENSVSTKAKYIRESDIKKMKPVLDESSSIRMEIKNIRSELDDLEGNAMLCMLLIAMVKSKDRIEELRTRLQQLEKSKFNITKYKLLPNMRFVQSFKEPGRLGDLVPLSELPTENQQINVGIIQTPRCKASVSFDLAEGPGSNITVERARKRGKSLKGIYLKEIDVSTGCDSDEHHCSISGITEIQNQLIIADNGNGNVKLVDLVKDEVIDVVDTCDSPWGVTRVSEHKVAVTVPELQTISFLEVSETLTKAGDILLTGKCHGVACSGDTLVVSFTHPAKIEVLDLTGNSLHLIYLDKEGGQLFYNPESIAVSSDGQTLFVLNSDKNCLTCVKIDGTLKRNYKFPGISELADIALVSDDLALVCGWGDHKIRSLHSDDARDEVLLSVNDGVRFPQSLCYSHNSHNRLYVGLAENKVKIFQLIYA